MKALWENRYKYAMILAAIGSVFGIISFLRFYVFHFDSNPVGAIFGGISTILWLLPTLAAYLCGGLWTAIKSAANIAKWGWLVVPFPYDLITFAFVGVFALMAFAFLPIIPVAKAAKDKRDKDTWAQIADNLSENTTEKS